MAKGSAPAKLTGGRGFYYEDLVAARFLLGLLGAAHPLGSDLGRLVRIDWQAGDIGWRLDDLALTFGAGDQERCAGMSNKSHKQVTEGGFNDSFTRACWEQWLGVSTPRTFREDRDLLGLVTGALADGVRTAWDTLLGGAIETAAAPERLVARLQAPAAAGAGSLSSEMQRSLFQSLQCPADLQAGTSTNDVAAARLTRHVRLLHLDFESVPSRAQAEAIAECRDALEVGTADKAQDLWEVLVGIAARKRGRGGSIDLRELLSRLRRQFSLRDHPDYQPDWNELDRRSRERIEAIGVTVGNASPLSRSSVRRRISRHLRECRTCVVIGESGVGKSAIVRRLGEGHRYRLVWLTADQLHSGRQSTFEELLGLRHPFCHVLQASPNRCLVVFDGIEGFSESGLLLVARLIASIRSGSRGIPRIAVTVQPDGLARLQAAFAEAKVPLEPCAFLEVRPPSQDAVQRLLESFPGLSWAALRAEFRSLLRNLKVFDWVVRLQESGGLSDTPELVTLTAIIDRLWAHFVESGESGLGRSSLLKRVAATEADQLVQGFPLLRCDAGDLSALPVLEAAGLVRRQDERVRFAHDLLADWARLKYLVEQRLTESDPTILRAANAGWYRAVRLYAQRILEQPGDRLARWHRDVQALGDGNPERVIIRDLFLEALVLASNSRQLLSSAWPVLIAGEGKLLSLLLDRFAYVGTVADLRALSGIADPAAAAQLEHMFRVPFEAYWYGVLPVLAEHPDDVIRCALAPAARLLRLWLSTVPPRRRATLGLRDAAARLTLTLAREVQAREAEGRRSVEQEVRTDIYVALLWAVPEIPGETTHLCLELANRRPEANQVRQRREAAREENRLATERFHASRPEAAALTRRLVTPEDVFGPKQTPWPDGPSHRVDEAFQKACLDRQAIFPLVVNQPREALEIFLAVLIQNPRRQRWAEDSPFRMSLGLDDNRHCHPPFFHQGPFFSLLRSSEITAEFALSLIIRVVNFATERWQEHDRKLAAKYSNLEAEGPSCVTVPTSDGWKEFFGDRSVLRWHDGWATRPAVLSSMLMAVEKWLYDEADAGRPVDRWVGKILSEGRSAALIGVLVSLAKYKPELLCGPLRPLAGAWEIYAGEARLQLEQPSLAFWSMDWMRYGETAWNRARDWYTMPHRKTMLLNHVMPLVLQNDAIRSEVLAFHQHWEKLLEANPDNLHLRGLIDHFGIISRYVRAAAEGGEKVPDFYQWLRSQQQEAAAAEGRAKDELLPLTLAHQCRKRIDENQDLRPDELSPFWDTLHQLSGQPERSMERGTHLADAVFGGIAVLLLLHRDWVREDTTREQWCRDQLKLALRCPPGRKPYDFPDSIGRWDWDTFVPECGVALLAENACDPLARELVLAGLSCFRFATVAATMRRAYRLRDRLGGEFDRMVEFVAEWSSLVWALRWSGQWGLATKRFWTRQCVPRLNTFARGGEPPPRQSLADIYEAGRRLTASLFSAYRTKCERHNESWLRRIARWTGIPWLIDRLRACRLAEKAKSQANPDEDDDVLEADCDHPTLYGGVPPTWPGLDLNYLSNGFAWLEIASKEQPLSEYATGALRELLAVSLRTMPASDRKKPRQSVRFPTEFDQWLYERIGEALPRLPKQKAEDLWMPILSLGVRREYWVKYFLSDCFRAAADKGVQPEVFVAFWKQLIRFALDKSGWDTNGETVSDAEDVVVELLGLEMGKAVFGDDIRYAEPIASITPLFEDAASRWFIFGKVAARFCRFAQKPAGAELLLRGVRWLAAAEPSWSEWCWEHDSLAEALVDALRAALDRHRSAIAANPESRSAFFHLCNQLMARGYPAALALRERIAAGHSEENLA
jgi:hypothetical protein